MSFSFHLDSSGNLEQSNYTFLEGKSHLKTNKPQSKRHVSSLNESKNTGNKQAHIKANMLTHISHNI